MPLSSNSVLHFTSKTNLKSILEDNFQVRYRLEEVTCQGRLFKFHVPMVCFCDIPLSEIKSHIALYGSYGIGLTKAWARRNGLNPILYLEQTSYLAQSLIALIDGFPAIELDNKRPEPLKASLGLINIVRYLKNYQGKMMDKKTNTVNENYKFTDEREWRFVPTWDFIQDPMLTGDISDTKLQEENERISERRLKFTPDDVTYIIINDDSEIAEFIELLRHAKGTKYEKKHIERLTTRLLTTEQIKNDI